MPNLHLRLMTAAQESLGSALALEAGTWPAVGRRRGAGEGEALGGRREQGAEARRRGGGDGLDEGVGREALLLSLSLWEAARGRR